MSIKKTILIKFSGALLGSSKKPVDMPLILKIAKQIKGLNSNGRLAIVCGAGNIFRGREVEKLGLDMATAHLTGMTATLVNALALKNAFDSLGLSSRIVSALAYPQVFGNSEKLSLKNCLQRGEILIFAAGTGNPFVTTDMAAVTRALEISADFILKATQIKGIYDHDPQKYPQARQIKKITYQQYLSLPTTDIFDKAAVVLAAEHSLPVYFFKWGPGQLKLAIKFQADGSLLAD